MIRSAPLLLLAALLLGCPARDADTGERIHTEIVGTWEVVDEPETPLAGEAGPRPFTAEGHRYLFAADSTLQIYRPRTLGPASTIFAVYDFRGDTLVIMSQFDSGYYLPHVSNDTLYLTPADAGRPMALVRVESAAPRVDPPPAEIPGEGGDYTPPSDLPPEEMPPN
jgi:hypothetical protein